jgi:hypothetical protein
MANRGTYWAYAALLGAVAALLAGCNDPNPLWGPGTPQNGAGEYIDSHTGLTIPGGPNSGTGGSPS